MSMLLNIDSEEDRNARAKAAALQADATLPDADPVPSVGYTSRGNTLVIGCAENALPRAEQLSAQLPVSVLLTDGPARIPPSDTARFPIFFGEEVKAGGWLGAFEVSWRQAGKEHQARFDLLLDLSETPLIASHQPPHGYFKAGDVQSDQLARMVGEFEKPRYFTYKEKLCAHGRNRKTGCSACIDICSAEAIAGAGERIKVNPWLCAGCGACTTVCPTGALSYAYPSAPYTGTRLKTLLTAYADAGGEQAVILFHSARQGKALIDALEQTQGLPARLMPMELQHAASTGIDVWLAAIAYGASGVIVLTSVEDAPQYIEALSEQMNIAQTILSGLGYAGRHMQLIQADAPEQLDQALSHAPKGDRPEKAATFHIAADKRNALDFALDHLYRHAPQKQERIALAPGAPFGAVEVDVSACTLCMSCTGACPASALMAGVNLPQLRFIEKNCVQCGLCTATCPEHALTLVPRMSFSETSKNAVVLNESQPFHCIRCNKPFGTLHMIENMLARLSAHGAFSGNLDRLRMCGDCRVIDMMESQLREAAIVEVKRPG